MKDFFLKLLNSESDVSSKRFISIFAMFLLTIVIIVSLLGQEVQEEIIYTLASLVLGSGLLTLSRNKS